MLRVLEERGFPVTELRPLASARSEGRELDYLGRPRTVRTLTADAFEGIQIALFSAGATRSREFAPAAVEAGAVVIDNSSAYRMDPAVPLVVPEVNEADLEGHAGIVANPNCVAAPLVVALKPIADAVGLERVIVSSYQSVSGTGAGRRDRAARAGGRATSPATSPSRPCTRTRSPSTRCPTSTSSTRSGYTGEERKVAAETRKMLGHARPAPSAPPACGCRCSTPTPSRCRSRPPSAIGAEARPQPADGRPRGGAGGRAGPRTATRWPARPPGRDEVFVGRIREDRSHDRGLVLWVSSDNLRKGAATNAVQIAESLVTRGWL